MAASWVVFQNGFDKYGPPNTVSANVVALLDWEWTSFSTGTATIVAPLSSTGQALQITGTAALNKTLTGTWSRLVGGFRFNTGATLAAMGLVLTNSSLSALCAIGWNAAGNIVLWRGGVGGTVVNSGGAISINSTHTLSFDITVGASGAAYQVSLDGASLFSGTGDTTGSSTAFGSLIISVPTQTMQIDDLFIGDPTQATYNSAVLTSNPRIETQFPTGDSSVAFSFGAAILGRAYQAIGSASAPGANELFLRTFTPSINCTINSVACIPASTSGPANFKAVIYSDSSGSPQSLLSSGTQVTGATSGTTLTGALTTPQSLSAGTPYWIGFITDTSVALQEVDSTTTGEKASNTYTSGAPGTAPAMISGQPSWIIYGNISGTGANYYELAISPPPGDTSYVFDSNVGDEDLYNFPPLTTTTAAIYTMGVKALVRDATTGSRTINLQTKSGGTDGTGSASGLAPATSYGWLDSYFDTDPNTSAAWTPSGVNAAVSGVKIAS